MNPYQPPNDASAPAQTAVDVAALREIATYQRYINLAILANIIGTLALFGAPSGLQLVMRIGLVVVGLASAVSAVLLAKAMHGFVWAVIVVPLVFVPCVNLLTLLVLNQGATTRLKKAGYRVGLLGANPADIR